MHGRADSPAIARLARATTRGKYYYPRMDPPSHCDSCGQPLDEAGHYIVRIEVFADPASPQIRTDGSAGEGEAIAALIEQMSEMSADELQDQVHRRFEYRVCPRCQKQILVNPLGRPRVMRMARN